MCQYSIMGFALRGKSLHWRLIASVWGFSLQVCIRTHMMRRMAVRRIRAQFGVVFDPYLSSGLCALLKLRFRAA